ncbi:WSC domain [Lithohypha guttulata]|uniref:WSC domain n=1 Tax=Lithohypha guttulata TaxID=1690604 RepID=A0AAN7Y8Q1_9EURO|nr:WSC domain [Lithohypha guttulata]KAK5081350.1 WSC domain [Lithohypha guttulata]KAK5101993.1 WSC domain [Lithohypha guttulata]
MAIVSGSTCFCGDEIPSDANKLPNNDTCNTPCNGFDAKFCGGLQSWTVYLSGIGYAPTASNITSSSASSSQAPTSATHAAETIVVTQSSRPSSTQLPSDDEGPNKVGIAVGVVVGVVAIAAIAAGVLFFLRHRRRRQLEEEHKAQAAVNSFVGSRASDQKSDARLDPSMASSYRRESIGSIADERDFSRRILQVRNPDRGSMTSVA